MRLINALKLVGTIAALPLLTSSVFAANDHWDKFSCYAWVHDQCYANNQNNCSGEDYNWGLDQCDGYYPSAAIKRPDQPQGLTTRGNNQRIRATFSTTFQKGR
jgi:hypothetical protein